MGFLESWGYGDREDIHSLNPVRAGPQVKGRVLSTFLYHSEAEAMQTISNRNVPRGMRSGLPSVAQLKSPREQVVHFTQFYATDYLERPSIHHDLFFMLLPSL